MQETLNFLTIIDDKIKRGHMTEHRKLHTMTLKDKTISKRVHRYPFAKAMDFRESKYN